MEWNPSLSVGVELIDNQHKELFRRIDGFYDAMKNGRGKDEVLNVLQFMLDYTVKHFTAEEGIQRNAAYPRYADHKKLHDAFVKDIRDMKAEMEASGVTVASSSLVGMTLSNWLISHISVEDKKLATYIRERG